MLRIPPQSMFLNTCWHHHPNNLLSNLDGVLSPELVASQRIGQCFRFRHKGTSSTLFCFITCTIPLARVSRASSVSFALNFPICINLLPFSFSPTQLLDIFSPKQSLYFYSSRAFNSTSTAPSSQRLYLSDVTTLLLLRRAQHPSCRLLLHHFSNLPPPPPPPPSSQTRTSPPYIIDH